MNKETWLNGWHSAVGIVEKTGNKIKDNVQALGENIADDYDKFKEIGQIREKGRQLFQDADKQMATANGILEYEYRQFEQLSKEIEEGILYTYVQYCRYMQITAPKGIREQEIKAMPAYADCNLWQETGNALAGAVAAGTAAGVMTLGMVTAVGTASTGTALSALSGAAYVNATLAALGGGAVATGGLGMAGGLAVLGTAVAAPAAAVIGYFFDKNIKTNHAEAVKWLAEVEEYVKSSNDSSTRARTLSFYLQLKIREIYAFQLFFRDVLNTAVGAAACGDALEYRPILNDAATTLIAYIQLPVTMEGNINSDYLTLLKKLQGVAAACRRQFYAYILKQSTVRQHFLENVREQDLAEHQDDFSRWFEIIEQTLTRMEDKIENVHADMQRRFDKVDESLLDIKASLSVLGEDIRRMQEETISKLSMVAGDREKTERILNEMADNMSKRLLEASAIQQNRHYAEQKLQLSELFGLSWEKLQPQSRKFLISSRILYQELSGLGNQVDFSGVCILAVKALENELHHRFYNDFVEYLQNKYPLADCADKWPSYLYRTNRWGKNDVLSERHFTLGSIPFLCGVRCSDRVSDAQHERDGEVVFKYAQKKLLLSGLDDNEVRKTLQVIGSDTDKIAQKYRNPAAHINALQQADAEECLRFLLEVEKVFIWIMERFAY